MTKKQKTDYVLAAVQEARVWFTQDEFTKMVKQIWDGLDNAQTLAVENTSPVTPQ